MVVGRVQLHENHISDLRILYFATQALESGGCRDDLLDEEINRLGGVMADPKVEMLPSQHPMPNGGLLKVTLQAIPSLPSTSEVPDKVPVVRVELGEDKREESGGESSPLIILGGNGIIENVESIGCLKEDLQDLREGCPVVTSESGDIVVDGQNHGRNG